jgi:hypothetical protein
VPTTTANSIGTVILTVGTTGAGIFGVVPGAVTPLECC